MSWSLGRDLADLIRAFETLEPDGDDECRRIAGLLGLGWSSGGADAASPEATPPRQEPAPGPPPAEPVPPWPPPPPPRPRRRRRFAEPGVALEPLDPDDAPAELATPRWLDGVEALPDPRSERRPPPPPLEPLLDLTRTRALLVEALGAIRPDGPIDVETLEERLARALPLVELPRLPRRSLAFGLDLLVDRSPALAPFFADQDALVERVLRLVDPERLRVLHFKGTPLDGAGRGPRRLWTAWTPPRPARPVVLLTDLGVGGGTPVSEWLRFVDRARRAGCPLGALVPYPRERWPRRLAGELVVLEWDRDLTVRAVRRALGRSAVATG